jgi:hypothetical protein
LFFDIIRFGIWLGFQILLGFLSIINIVFLLNNRLNWLSDNWLNRLNKFGFLRLNNVSLRFGLNDLSGTLLFVHNRLYHRLLYDRNTWFLNIDSLYHRL